MNVFFAISLLSLLGNRINLNSMLICAKFGWNWHSDSGKEDENAMISSQTATDYAIANRK